MVKQFEGFVDDGSGCFEGEDDFVVKDEDDVFWEVEEISLVFKIFFLIVNKDKKVYML